VSPFPQLRPLDPKAFLLTVYDSMKPDAVIAVTDHVGPAGDTRAIVEKLHRIDPAVIKADFKRAVFVLDAESNLLRNSPTTTASRSSTPRPRHH